MKTSSGTAGGDDSPDWMREQRMRREAQRIKESRIGQEKRLEAIRKGFKVGVESKGIPPNMV